MVQAILSDVEGIFQDDNAPTHTAHMVKYWNEKHESELEHTKRSPKYPDLITIENLRCVLERPSAIVSERARAGFNEKMADELKLYRKLEEDHATLY